MGYQVQLPRTDDDREAALNIAKQRKDDPPPSGNVFSLTTSNLLDAEQPKFILVRKALHDAEENDHQAIEIFNPLLQKLKSKSSHGLQLINFKVSDLDTGFTPATRLLYAMDLEGRLPAMNTEDEIIQAANNFITGETVRVAQGGTALADITKASVEALLTDVNAKRLIKQATANALSEAHLNIAAERLIVDPLIKTMWGDIEHAAQGMPVGARHEFCISWGMTFVHTPGVATVNVRTEDIDSGQPLAGVALRIGKPDGTGGTKAVTNNHGEAIMESKNFQLTAIIAELALYDTLVKEMTLTEDETLHLVLKMKKSAQ
jgi:hypothetical protein